MSFVGKVLVVVQVVMSLCFMAFAGAVYFTQTNWKTQYETAQTQLTERDTAYKNLEENLSQARDEATKARQDSQQELDRWKREALTKTQLLDQKTNELNQVNSQKEQLLANARSKQTEAENREKETEVYRKQNTDLQVRNDALNGQLTKTEDELFNTNISLTRLQQRYDDLLKKSAYLEKVVALHKLPTEPATIAKMEMPAPPLDGLVQEVRLNSTGRTQFVVITVGQDDGLREGHDLSVYRLSNGDGKTLYLGKIRLIDVGADHAVGEVIQSAKNGNIEVGDNVSTKL
jgi:multidrug efflux pump subunit AcrA (membrane-fusion protein)